MYMYVVDTLLIEGRLIDEVFRGKKRKKGGGASVLLVGVLGVYGVMLSMNE